jgi:hypothetical protein
MDVLRSRYRALIVGLADNLVAPVKATKKSLPTRWAGASPAEDITALLGEAGKLDFRDLSADDIVGWLAAADSGRPPWPRRQPRRRTSHVVRPGCGRPPAGQAEVTPGAPAGSQVAARQPSLPR